MAIPMEHRAREAFHFVHLNNLKSIITQSLLSNAEQEHQGVEHHSIAIRDIQRTRAKMAVTCAPGGVVHDYVPFYFCKRSPMLLSVVNARNVDQQFLVYLVIPLTLLDSEGAVFTNASANRAAEPPQFYADPQDLDKLNWQEIDSLKWSSATEELKQQKMAELLIQKRVGVSQLSRLVVWNEEIAGSVRDVFAEGGASPPEIGFNSRHYYTKYPTAPNQSLVTGPWWTQRRFEGTVAEVLKKLGAAKSPHFERLADLRNALRDNLGCIPETAELLGFETSNIFHADDLGTHTRKVAEQLRQLPEFESLNDTDKLLSEIAAYLHDIGKGPKQRWTASSGKYGADRDHPVEALPMVARILTEEVATMKRRSVHVICKLACYHDLIGDIVSKGRNEDQLFAIIDDERELDMLIALSKADISAVNRGWWREAEVTELRQRALDALAADDE